MLIKVQKIKNDWNEVPSGITWYFIGPPKTGKTTNASRWSEKGSDGVIILDTDLGTRFVDNANTIPITSFNPPVEEILNPDGTVAIEMVNGKAVSKVKVIPPEERGYIYLSGKNKGKPMPVYSLVEAVTWLKSNWKDLHYDTVVIDTVDIINQWQEQMVIDEYGVDSVADLSFGKGWSIPKKNILKSIKGLQEFLKLNLGNLILISHSKKSNIEDNKVQLVPDLPAGLGEGLCGLATVIGYTEVSKKTNKYYVSFESYGERSIGSRLAPIAQKKMLFDYKTIKEAITTYKES